MSLSFKTNRCTSCDNGRALLSMAPVCAALKKPYPHEMNTFVTILYRQKKAFKDCRILT